MDNTVVSEQEELDYRVNKYTVKCLKITVVGMLLVWLADLLHIFIVNFQLLTLGMLTASAITFGAIVFAKFVDLHKYWVKYVLIFLTVLSITILGITLTYHTVLLSVLPLLLATQYSNKRMIIYTYILSIVSIYLIVMGGYWWGLCDANMLTLTTEQTRYYFDGAANAIHFSVPDANPWIVLPLYYVVPRSLLLLLLLPVIQSISANITECEMYAVTMKNRSENDDMTGLFNRNKYMQMKEEYYPAVDTVGVIFWDVNNLKQTNDTLGHRQGDFLINTTAHMIKKLQNANRIAYRIGGDEFVMIVSNPKEDELKEILHRWDEMVKETVTGSKIPYSVAMGMAVGAGKNIDDVVKQADEQMYRKKTEQKE